MASLKLPAISGIPPEAYESARKPPHPHKEVHTDYQPVKRWIADQGNKLDYLTHRVTEKDAREADLGADFFQPGALRRAECTKTMGKSGLVQAYEDGGPEAAPCYPEYKALPVLTQLYKIDETGDYIVPPSLRQPIEMNYGIHYRSLWHSTPFPHRLQDLKTYWKNHIVVHKTPERQREWEEKIGCKFPTESQMLPEKRDCMEQLGRLCWHQKCLRNEEANWEANIKTPYTFQLPSFRDGYPSMTAYTGWCGGLPPAPPDPNVCCPFDSYKVVEPELRAKAARMDFPLNHFDAVYGRPGFPLHEWNYPKTSVDFVDRPERHPQNMPDIPWPPITQKMTLWTPPWLGKEKPDIHKLFKYSYIVDHHRPLWRSKPAYLPTDYPKPAWNTGLAPGYPA